MKYTFVNSVKGGCGKTTASLMWALKKADYDIPTACIVDLDILGTAFESIVANRCFVKTTEKNLEGIPVLEAAEVYLNDLCRNAINFKRNYISKLEFDGYRTDVILASPDFKDKSLFIPNYNNQYMAGVSYDYFKSIAKRLLNELDKYEFSITGYDGIEYKQELVKTYNEYNSLLEDSEKAALWIDSLEPMKACMEGVKQKIQELNEAKKVIPVIKRQYHNMEYIKQCSELDELIRNKVSLHSQKLSDIIEKAKSMTKYAGRKVSQYSEVVFDMPPNSEPYSDIFLEMVLGDKLECADDITFILVSSLNRAHIDANIRWLKDFLTRAASQKWRLPKEIIFVFNDSGDLLSKKVQRSSEDIQVNGDLLSQNNKRTDDYKKYKDVFDEYLPAIKTEIEGITKKEEIQVDYYQLDYMQEYANAMLSKKGLTSIEFSKLHKYEPQER